MAIINIECLREVPYPQLSHQQNPFEYGLPDLGAYEVDGGWCQARTIHMEPIKADQACFFPSSGAAGQYRVGLGQLKGLLGRPP